MTTSRKTKLIWEGLVFGGHSFVVCIYNVFFQSLPRTQAMGGGVNGE